MFRYRRQPKWPPIWPPIFTVASELHRTIRLGASHFERPRLPRWHPQLLETGPELPWYIQFDTLGHSGSMYLYLPIVRINWTADRFFARYNFNVDMNVQKDKQRHAKGA